MFFIIIQSIDKITFLSIIPDNLILSCEIKTLKC